ncbi:DUF3005 domain-containing protein [Burkholderia sp. FERM BP-3421]|uniref:DUF3005 domain-containing protein n=1 Tax=Burkholderia sp. FERM BP-3421 TaxID=1494466 RepID=UPI002360A7AA|nr:DUF3005 domain-containing protein [Burkholderia sp. FERM BP-3421]WDD90957.1 DUF3005 domain-containing protein [Burkholderia sp. FERM BP-3421]
MRHTGTPTHAERQREVIANSPVKTPAAGRDMPDAATQAAETARARPLSPERIAAKAATGLPPIDRDARLRDAGDDPVRRAASRIVSLDNANMAATDNTVDVDGKGMEARRGASKWQANVIHSNASLDERVDTPEVGLAGFESRAGGTLPRVVARAGWRVRHEGAVTIEVPGGRRVEQVFRFERSN